VDWLFEQLDTDFELAQTKLIPLLCNGKAIGAMVFEFRYPVDVETLSKDFQAITTIAAAMLNASLNMDHQQHMAEEFLTLLWQKPKAVQSSPKVQPKVDPLKAVAELAAGAAHELNNPLSVISGRAQLLTDSETDEKKKKILEQITENSGEVSRIVESLLSYAEPQPPMATSITVRQMLEEAIQITAIKKNMEALEINLDVSDETLTVFVDSAQAASAISNVLCNCLESYPEGFGPVKIKAESDAGKSRVKIQISDSGIGMDPLTLVKATSPFFSQKPAGRQRGMGLSHAERLIKLNGGSIQIMSQLKAGTTVIITLPIA
jgi:signal transduction histidine kinase